MLLITLIIICENTNSLSHTVVLYFVTHMVVSHTVVLYFVTCVLFLGKMFNLKLDIFYILESNKI